MAPKVLAPVNALHGPFRVSDHCLLAASVHGL
jgi:hypothetical protein